MVDEKKLHELTKQGIVHEEDGIRVIDASKLDGPQRLRPAPVKRTPSKPKPPPPAQEPEPEEDKETENRRNKPAKDKKTAVFFIGISLF